MGRGIAHEGPWKKKLCILGRWLNIPEPPQGRDAFGAQLVLTHSINVVPCIGLPGMAVGPIPRACCGGVAWQKGSGVAWHSAGLCAA